MFVTNGEARADEPDFTVRNFYGGIVILAVEAEAAKQWVDEHIAAGSVMWGRNGIAVAPRCVADLLNGIVDAGPVRP